jgi:hypothetical protein
VRCDHGIGINHNQVAQLRASNIFTRPTPNRLFQRKSTVTRPLAGLSIFATAYDPLDLASDSIDPLGFLKAYLSLADRMLPGFTTVTNVPRYLSMLCAGLRAAERTHPRDAGGEPAKSRGRRLEVLKNFEKLWALACGLANETRGKQAVAGLRGIRSVQRFLESNCARADLNTRDFNLLSNQVRYGGIGTYGQMLEACHFADWATLTLRPLGEELADVFPVLPGWSPERSDTRIAKATLQAWGEDVCLDTMSANEAKTMREGLNGGLEAERDDDVRWHCLRLLKSAGVASDASEQECLKQFRVLIEKEPLGDPRTAIAMRQLKVVAPLIDPLERLYQSLLFLFDEIRATATENPGGCHIVSLDEPGKGADAFTAAQRSVRDLFSGFAMAEKVDTAVSSPVMQSMRESGIIALAEQIAAAGTVTDAAGVLLRRHAAVQSGKFDRGIQKVPWLRVDNGVVRLTSQRNELQRGEHAKSWRNIGRHPYRTFAARQFIQQCRIA